MVRIWRKAVKLVFVDYEGITHSQRLATADNVCDIILKLWMTIADSDVMYYKRYVKHNGRCIIQLQLL